MRHHIGADDFGRVGAVARQHRPHPQSDTSIREDDAGTPSNIRCFRIANDCIFYCFVVADIRGKLEIHTNGWRTTVNGRGRIQDPSGKFRGYMEVIEWTDLIGDTRLRNHAFLHAAGLRYDKHL